MIFIVCWNSERLNLISTRLEQPFESETQDGAKACKRIKELKPEMIIFDLGSRPSHSLATADGLGKKTDSRIIFLDGSPEIIEKARKTFPNALFTTIETLPNNI